MCGVLYVHSDGDIDPRRHHRALALLDTRGPDLLRTQRFNRGMVAHSVLHITGDDEFYRRPHSDFLAYSGEIYNYRSFGAWTSDVDLVHYAVTQDRRLFQKFAGPWAWIYMHGDQVLYASDPQGERYLYRYQDEHITVVSTEVAVILCYITNTPVDHPYENKCWTMLEHTPWLGIERLEPGRMYGTDSATLDSMWQWIHPQNITLEQAQEEFDHLWPRVIREMLPECASTISYSGGIDSNLILAESPDQSLVAVNMLGKDPIVDRVDDFLSPEQQSLIVRVDVDVKRYAQDYRSMISRTRMPAQSWSFGGRWAAAKHTPTRVMFTGAAADELFGGYGVYQTITYDTQGSHSPYSSVDHSNLWQRCLSAYDQDPRQATLLMDYFYQVQGCDAPGQDRISGSWGIETRNPFQHRDIMTFALNLPWHLKVAQETKPILRHKFRKYYSAELELPKRGFAGHANDSLPWMGIDLEPTGDRDRDWKHIAKETFRAYTET